MLCKVCDWVGVIIVHGEFVIHLSNRTTKTPSDVMQMSATAGGQLSAVGRQGQKQAACCASP
jgi:hypothetical protein